MTWVSPGIQGQQVNLRQGQCCNATSCATSSKNATRDDIHSHSGTRADGTSSRRVNFEKEIASDALPCLGRTSHRIVIYPSNFYAHQNNSPIAASTGQSSAVGRSAKGRRPVLYRPRKPSAATVNTERGVVAAGYFDTIFPERLRGVPEVMTCRTVLGNIKVTSRSHQLKERIDVGGFTGVVRDFDNR